jgi:hypothetical protein
MDNLFCIDKDNDIFKDYCNYEDGQFSSEYLKMILVKIFNKMDMAEIPSSKKKSYSFLLIDLPEFSKNIILNYDEDNIKYTKLIQTINDEADSKIRSFVDKNELKKFLEYIKNLANLKKKDGAIFKKKNLNNEFLEKIDILGLTFSENNEDIIKYNKEVDFEHKCATENYPNIDNIFNHYINGIESSSEWKKFKLLNVLVNFEY